MTDVRAECKRQFGDGPCARVYAADLKTVTDTYDCVHWCAALNRKIEEMNDGDADE
jgi:hypothetical protein